MIDAERLIYVRVTSRSRTRCGEVEVLAGGYGLRIPHGPASQGMLPEPKRWGLGRNEIYEKLFSRC